jgi:transposase
MARKYTYEEKLNIVEGYLNGDFTLSEKAHELGYHAIPGCFQRWIKQYKVHGREGLHRKNRTYTSELKMKAVEEYLSGKDSAVNIVAKYDISCVDVLLRWVSLYNSNRKLKHSCNS